ncbi:MAG: sugar-binding domain-containing protein [Sedimentisphaerales bacterium]
MAKQILDLTGKWQFKEYPPSARRMRDLDAENWLDCSVPSSIYTCLVDAGLINLSDLNSNPKNFLWPSEKIWIFQKFFDASDELIESDKIELVFDGLDTFCQIWLNDKLIAKTDNMFCAYRFDVKPLLKKKNNRLLVKCESALEAGNSLMSRFGVLGLYDCSFPCRTYVRKAQCQFGWDWAPPLPGCGIWQPVRIEGFSSACLRDIHIRTVEADSAGADIRISTQIENFSGQSSINCKLTVLDPLNNICANRELEFGDRNIISTVLKIQPVSLWRPVSYGSQPLYTLKAELFSGNELVETSSKKFGIRTVQLNQTPDEIGSSFQFVINHHPVYVRGAAWIPFSLHIGSATEADYEKALTAAKEANINMLRVWGGGVYETDIFYNLCDRLGIMVWQDFTFACAYYPERRWFTEMIKTEAAQNIIRLRNHPSLMLWCGNNEIDWMHAKGLFLKSKKFYGKNIYHKILPQLVHELDPDRDYIRSTPLGPDKNPNEPTSGTVHQWEVWSHFEPTDNYLQQTPRFVSEFGFQAMPAKKTLQSFVPDKIHPASYELEKHNYQPNGPARLHYYINELFRPPKNIDEFIYLSQLMQARAIRKNVEHLRSNSNINGGVIFWQFNDSCPAVSWSCIDYAYRPKALYYYTKRLFSPVITTVSAQYDPSRTPLEKTIASLTTSIINHSPKPLTGLFICRMCDMNLALMDEFKRPFSISPDGFTSFSLPQSFVRPANPQDCFLLLSLENDKTKLSQNSFFYLPDKYINWPKANIEIKGTRQNDYEWHLKLKSLSAVKDLYMDLPIDAELSDNFFDLLIDETKDVNIRTKEAIEDLPKKILLTSVNSIFDA